MVFVFHLPLFIPQNSVEKFRGVLFVEFSVTATCPTDGKKKIDFIFSHLYFKWILPLDSYIKAYLLSC